jgi:hypothetical protein
MVEGNYLKVNICPKFYGQYKLNIRLYIIGKKDTYAMFIKTT